MTAVRRAAWLLASALLAAGFGVGLVAARIGRASETVTALTHPSAPGSKSSRKSLVRYRQGADSASRKNPFCNNSTQCSTKLSGASVSRTAISQKRPPFRSRRGKTLRIGFASSTFLERFIRQAIHAGYLASRASSACFRAHLNWWASLRLWGAVVTSGMVWAA